MPCRAVEGPVLRGPERTERGGGSWFQNTSTSPGRAGDTDGKTAEGKGLACQARNLNFIVEAGLCPGPTSPFG